MDYIINEILDKINKPFVSVDFNEVITNKHILLSQTDEKKDFNGDTIIFKEGMKLLCYCEDSDMAGNRDDIIVEGICIKNNTGIQEYVKWILEFDENGIRYISDIIKK